jgi:capsular exopolysaccharide synthesis family protein
MSLNEPSLLPPAMSHAPLPADGDSGRFSPLALWNAVRKNWLLIVLISAAVGLGVAFYTLGQKKIYEAEATLLFDPQPPRPLGNQVQGVVDMGGEYWNNKEYYKTQAWVIQSQRVAVEVVKELGLNKNRAFIENAPPNAPTTGREIGVEDAAMILRARLSVDPIRDSRLAVVRYRDADPARAQRVLGTLVDTYTQNNLDDALDAMNMAADWLSGQVGSLKTQLESSEMALHDYKKHKNILSVSMDDQSNMLRGEMQQLNQALTAAETRREQISARRSELLKINPEEPVNVPSTELLNSQLLQQLRGQYLDAVSQRLVLGGAGKGAGHPDVMAAQAKIEAARTALMAEVRNVQRAIDHEYNVTSQEAAGLRGLLESAKQRALDLNLLEIEYNRLRRSKDDNEKLYGVVTERSKENDLSRMQRINNIRVADRPQQPKRPVSPNVPLNVASGIAIGLVLGLAAAIGREQLDRSIKTPDDVERELGLTFLGLLPSVGTGKASVAYGRRKKRHKSPDDATHGAPELIVHEHPTSGVAEAARALRTNILFMAPDKQFRTLLVTSAAPAEGKTTVACCIAIAMAQAGRKVALLDCDMRRPRVHRVFGKTNEVGVTTALIDIASIDDIIRPTEVPNLSVVTTGPIPPNPAEILHSDTFYRLLNMLSDRFDHIVIDSPPVAPVTDAAVLSTRVDATILVVRAFKTSKELARRAVRALRDVGNRNVGTVLNAVDFERREYGYYQYYYYRREGYSAEVSGSPSSRTDAAPPPS